MMFALVAQWIEHLPPKQGVARSIRAGGTREVGLAERREAATGLPRWPPMRMGWESRQCAISVTWRTVWKELIVEEQRLAAGLAEFTKPTVSCMEPCSGPVI